MKKINKNTMLNAWQEKLRILDCNVNLNAEKQEIYRTRTCDSFYREMERELPRLKSRNDLFELIVSYSDSTQDFTQNWERMIVFPNWTALKKQFAKCRDEDPEDGYYIEYERYYSIIDSDAIVFMQDC